MSTTQVAVEKALLEKIERLEQENKFLREDNERMSHNIPIIRGALLKIMKSTGGLAPPMTIEEICNIADEALSK